MMRLICFKKYFLVLMVVISSLASCKKEEFSEDDSIVYCSQVYSLNQASLLLPLSLEEIYDVPISGLSCEHFYAREQHIPTDWCSLPKDPTIDCIEDRVCASGDLEDITSGQQTHSEVDKLARGLDGSKNLVSNSSYAFYLENGKLVRFHFQSEEKNMIDLGKDYVRGEILLGDNVLYLILHSNGAGDVLKVFKNIDDISEEFRMVSNIEFTGTLEGRLYKNELWLFNKTHKLTAGVHCEDIIYTSNENNKGLLNIMKYTGSDDSYSVERIGSYYGDYQFYLGDESLYLINESHNYSHMESIVIKVHEKNYTYVYYPGILLNNNSISEKNGKLMAFFYEHLSTSFVVFDETLTAIHKIKEFGTYYNSSYVKFDENMAYLSTSHYMDTLHMLDISNPENPKIFYTDHQLGNLNYLDTRIENSLIAIKNYDIASSKLEINLFKISKNNGLLKKDSIFLSGDHSNLVIRKQDVITHENFLIIKVFKNLYVLEVSEDVLWLRKKIRNTSIYSDILVRNDRVYVFSHAEINKFLLK